MAVGCAGMGVADFCLCTPREFAAILRAWREEREGRERAAWERMRLLAAITVQPHCKKKVAPARLLPLPWDRPQAGRENKATPPSTRARFEEAVARMQGKEVKRK